MPHITIALIGQTPRTVEADTLGDALNALGIDPAQTTFRANGQTVDTSYAPDEPVTVVGAKNLVGAVHHDGTWADALNPVDDIYLRALLGARDW